MNLTKLFKIQAKLDEKIVKKKGLEGQDLLDKKVLALQVELGELAQNWRGFKFWSDDQEPRTVKSIPTDWDDDGTPTEWNVNPHKNPLLEEHVDCLHFFLSIGNDLGVNKIEQKHKHRYDIETTFIHLLMGVGVISTRRDSVQEDNYKMTFSLFLRLGELLGFTWEEIEQSYYEKNRINHERQENGY